MLPQAPYEQKVNLESSKATYTAIAAAISAGLGLYLTIEWTEE